MDANDPTASHPHPHLPAAADVPAAPEAASAAPAVAEDDALPPKPVGPAPGTGERATVRVPPPRGKGAAAPKRKPPTVRLFHPGQLPPPVRIPSRGKARKGPVTDRPGEE